MNNSPSTFAVALVDDDEVYREYVVALLSFDNRFTVFPSASSTELAQILVQRRVDSIVLDVELGRESGFTVKEELDAGATHQAAVVMLTGSGCEGSVIRALRLGVHDYVSKRALTGADLVAALER